MRRVAFALGFLTISIFLQTASAQRRDIGGGRAGGAISDHSESREASIEARNDPELTPYANFIATDLKSTVRTVRRELLSAQDQAPAITVQDFLALEKTAKKLKIKPQSLIAGVAKTLNAPTPVYLSGVPGGQTSSSGQATAGLAALGGGSSNSVKSSLGSARHTPSAGQVAGTGLASGTASAGTFPESTRVPFDRALAKAVIEVKPSLSEAEALQLSRAAVAEVKSIPIPE